jgi:hypothetical protein
MVFLYVIKIPKIPNVSKIKKEIFEYLEIITLLNEDFFIPKKYPVIKNK